MYLALFLMPWMAVYALATLGANHRDFLKEYYGSNILQFEIESERVYERKFASDASPREIAAQIVEELDIRGPYALGARSNTSRIVVFRGDPFVPRRITYTPADGKLVVERRSFRFPAFLTALHHRHGYRSEHAVNDLWGVTVDLVVFAMVFWVGSGLWMWWEIKVTRRWGVVCLAIGFALFALFLFTI